MNETTEPENSKPVNPEGYLFRASPETGELMEALAKAQGEFPPIPRTRDGHFGKYADLADVNSAIIPHLSAAGIAVINPLSGEYVICRLQKGEQFIETAVKRPMATDMKALGSDTTYLRRYLLTGLAGVQSEDDADHAGETERDEIPGIQKPSDPDAGSRKAFLSHLAKHGINSSGEFMHIAQKIGALPKGVNVFSSLTADHIDEILGDWQGFVNRWDASLERRDEE